MGRSKTQTPIFPSGVEYDAMPAGARQTKALWKRAGSPPGWRLADLPEDAIEVDLEIAIETEANMRLVAILQSGKQPSMQDLERCATKPPMSGQRLGDLLRRLGHQAEQYTRVAVQTRHRVMGSKGGSVGRGQPGGRKDPYAQKRADVLKAWRNRTNKLEGALPWAERQFENRAITVKPRTAAGWIRKAEPKKKQRRGSASG